MYQYRTRSLHTSRQNFGRFQNNLYVVGTGHLCLMVPEHVQRTYILLYQHSLTPCSSEDEKNCKWKNGICWITLSNSSNTHTRFEHHAWVATSFECSTLMKSSILQSPALQTYGAAMTPPKPLISEWEEKSKSLLVSSIKLPLSVLSSTGP